MLKAPLISTFRALGKSLDTLGRALELHGHVERLQPATRNIGFRGVSPDLKNSGFIAPSATIVGQVSVGTSSSVWYGAVVRGDVNTITIGNDVTVGEMAMIHCSGISNEAPTTIGNRVVVGVAATIHGATIHDESIIGDRATILDGAIVQSHSIVGAGSLVGYKKVIPSGQLWAGVPAVFIRNLTAAEIANFSVAAIESTEWAALHGHECGKTWQVIEEEEEFLDQQESRNSEYLQPISDEMKSKNMGEIEGHQIPGRIFNSKISATASGEDCREGTYK